MVTVIDRILLTQSDRYEMQDNFIPQYRAVSFASAIILHYLSLAKYIFPDAGI